MAQVVYPKSYMTKRKYHDVYNSDLTFYGNRLLYTDLDGKAYIIKKDNKAYQVTLAQFDNKKFIMLKPKGIVKSWITSTGGK